MRTTSWYPPGTSLDGEPLVLDSGSSSVGLLVPLGVAGHESPAWEVVTTRAPGVDGSRFGHASAFRPDVQVPVFVEGTRSQVRAHVAQLAEALSPRNGAGLLVLTESVGVDDGTARYLRCVYQGGLEGDGTAAGEQWAMYTLHFEALDPFWYDVDPARGSWVGQPAELWFPWDFPWGMSPMGLTVDVPLDVGGQVTAWPSWLLTPPWTRVRVTNDRSGEWWELRRDAAEMWLPVTVAVTAAGQATVRGDDGVSRFGWRTAGSQWFGLAPGDEVSVQVDGGDSATRVDVEAGVGWLTCW